MSVHTDSPEKRNTSRRCLKNQKNCGRTHKSEQVKLLIGTINAAIAEFIAWIVNTD
jgi:hypothetical protein